MPIVEEDNGSQTAVIDTEHTLKSLTADGLYVLYVDLSNMVDGDRTVIKTKVKIKSAGSEVILFEDLVIGTDIEDGTVPPLYETPATAMTETMSYTLEQTDGTGRAYDWQVVKST